MKRGEHPYGMLFWTLTRGDTCASIRSDLNRTSHPFDIIALLWGAFQSEHEGLQSMNQNMPSMGALVGFFWHRKADRHLGGVA